MNNKLEVYILLFVLTITIAGGSILYLFNIAKGSDVPLAKEYLIPRPLISGYHEYAVLTFNLVNHQVFSQSRVAPFEPDVFRTPGYPVFMIPSYAIFGNFYLVLVEQVIMLFLTAILIFKMANKLIGQKWAKVLTTLYLFLPSTVLSASYLDNENLFVFIFVIALYLFFFSEMKNFYLKWALTGFLLALSAYIRPASLYILFFFVPAYFLFFIKWSEISRKHLIATALLILVFMGTLAPWCIRNKYKTGIFAFTSTGPLVLFSQNAGIFYQTMNGLTFDEALYALEDMAGIPRGPIPVELKYYDVMKKVALEVIFAHPFRYTFFHLSSSVSFFTSSSAHVYWRFVKDIQPDFYLTAEPYLIQALNPFSWPLLVTVVKNHGWRLVDNTFWAIITLLAFASVWWSKNVRLSRMFLAIIFYFAFVTGPMSYARYRMPVEPLLLICAFGTVAFLWSRHKERSFEKINLKAI